MMGLSMLILLVFVGLGLVAAIVAVVVVVALSRREDFVNPFSKAKAEPVSMSMPNVSAQVSRDVSPRVKHPESDLEAALVDWLIDQASAQTGMKLTNDPMVRERVINAARIAINELEEQDSYTVSLPFIAADEKGPKHFEIKLTRQTLKQIR